LLFLTASLVTGCGLFIAQRQRAALEKEVVHVREECNALLADAALDPIRDKVAFFNADQPPLAMRTNTSYASAEEKPVIALWAQKRDQCYRISDQLMAMVPAQIVALMTASRQVTDSMIAELYLGNITYGELANKRAKNAAEYRVTVANIEQALTVQNQQAKFQAQHLANQAISNWNAQMQTQALRQMQRQSNSINCTSNQLGNSTYTNCY